MCIHVHTCAHGCAEGRDDEACLEGKEEPALLSGSWNPAGFRGARAPHPVPTLPARNGGWRAGAMASLVLGAWLGSRANSGAVLPWSQLGGRHLRWQNETEEGGGLGNWICSPQLRGRHPPRSL